MQVSHSRVEQFEMCPFKFKMRYVDDMTTLPNDDPANALYLGTAVHTGLEKGAEAAIKQYYSNYPVITDAHINEAMKLEVVIPKASKLIPPGGQFEIKVENEHFVGYLDLITPATIFQRGVEVSNQFDLYDFKYSNNISHYEKSRQLHLYKYFFEKMNPGKFIMNMFFLFVPKVSIKQKKTEDLGQFRKRLHEELEKAEPKLVQIEYDPNKVIDFTFGVKEMLEATDYEKNFGWLCNYCDYRDYCQKGIDFMLLPKNERRNIEKVTKRKIWLYGASFTGKTTMLDGSPNPLNLNTDGNVQFVTMPYLTIADEVKVNGRMTTRKFAWEVLKDILDELEKKQNDFETLIVDLVDDTREMCRLYMYDKLGIQHESDSGFGKGWDIIKTEYLSTMMRFFNLPYENLVIVSKEDVSKDITKKSGEKITKITPSIQDAVANKLAGMVDLVARVIAEEDGSRTLNFKTDEVIFGGGRLSGVTSTKIPLSWEALMGIYDEANKSAAARKIGEAPVTASTTGRSKKAEAPVETPAEPSVDDTVQADGQGEPEKEPETVAEQVTPAEAEVVETPAPATRQRKKRGEN